MAHAPLQADNAMQDQGNLFFMLIFLSAGCTKCSVMESFSGAQTVNVQRLLPK
jgi:hypothetical protein